MSTVDINLKGATTKYTAAWHEWYARSWRPDTPSKHAKQTASDHVRRMFADDFRERTLAPELAAVDASVRFRCCKTALGPLNHEPWCPGDKVCGHFTIDKFLYAVAAKPEHLCAALGRYIDICAPVCSHLQIDMFRSICSFINRIDAYMLRPYFQGPVLFAVYQIADPLFNHKSLVSNVKIFNVDCSCGYANNDLFCTCIGSYVLHPSHPDYNQIDHT
jgi:hypothetical protein